MVSGIQVVRKRSATEKVLWFRLKIRDGTKKVGKAYRDGDKSEIRDQLTRRLHLDDSIYSQCFVHHEKLVTMQSATNTQKSRSIGDLVL